MGLKPVAVFTDKVDPGEIFTIGNDDAPDHIKGQTFMAVPMEASHNEDVFNKYKDFVSGVWFGSIK